MDDVSGAARAISPSFKYPRVFQEFTEQHAFVAFDIGGVRVYSNLQGEEDNVEGLLADRILTRGLVDAGFLPFGRPVTGSYDRICFDVRGLQYSEDAPVVWVDHEAILSKDRVPKPRRLADGLMEWLDRARNKGGPAESAD
jgi:hypothetical protein